MNSTRKTEIAKLTAGLRVARGMACELGGLAELEDLAQREDRHHSRIDQARQTVLGAIEQIEPSAPLVQQPLFVEISVS